MGDTFPASGFLKLAQLVEAEGEVFQYHVLDLLKEHRDDSEFHSRAMETLHARLSPREIEYFIESLQDTNNYAAGAQHVKDILGLVAGLSGSHLAELEAAHIIAAELIHRKKWEKVMDENPGTLQALKDRMA